MQCSQPNPATEQPSARFGAGPWPRFCLLAVILIPGCQRTTTSSSRDDDDEHHAAHVIPAHKPKTFPDAVRCLRELTPRLDDPATLPIATDIAGWLPEIAADSDMPEPQWNLVSSQSALLVQSLSRLAPNAPKVDSAPERARCTASVSNLEKLLYEADPRWFQQKLVNSDSK